LLKREPHATMLRYYKALIKLRKENLPLYLFRRDQLEVTADEVTQTLILQRWYGNRHKCIFMNFSAQRQLCLVPGDGKKWRRLLDSAAPEWNGPQAAPVKIKSGDPLVLQPESVLIYTHHA